MKEQKKLCIASDKKKLISCLNELKNGIFKGEFNESHLINLRSSILNILKDIETIEIKQLIQEVMIEAENELNKLHKQML